MRTEQIRVAEGPRDLLALPVGSKILTPHHRVFELDEIEPGRHDSGTRYWITPGELQPFPLEGLDHWFPAFILPNRQQT